MDYTVIVLFGGQILLKEMFGSLHASPELSDALLCKTVVIEEILQYVANFM